MVAIPMNVRCTASLAKSRMPPPNLCILLRFALDHVQHVVKLRSNHLILWSLSLCPLAPREILPSRAQRLQRGRL